MFLIAYTSKSNFCKCFFHVILSERKILPGEAFRILAETGCGGRFGESIKLDADGVRLLAESLRQKNRVCDQNTFIDFALSKAAFSSGLFFFSEVMRRKNVISSSNNQFLFIRLCLDRTSSGCRYLVLCQNPFCSGEMLQRGYEEDIRRNHAFRKKT